MTIPRIAALKKYWVKHPRADWLVAAYLKYKPADERPKDQLGMADLISQFGVKPGQTIVSDGVNVG